MKSSIIIIAIVVGMIAAALAAVDSTGVSIDVPERASAARGRGVKGVNSKPNGKQRSNKPARKQVGETRGVRRVRRSPPGLPCRQDRHRGGHVPRRRGNPVEEGPLRDHLPGPA